MSAKEAIGLATYLIACGGFFWLLAKRMGYWE